MSGPIKSNSNSGLEDAASFWAVRLSSPDCTPEDRMAFDAWRREDAAHHAVFERTQRSAAFVDSLVADPLMQELVEQARVETRPAGLAFFAGHWMRAGIAAMALIGIGLGALFVSGTLGTNGQNKLPEHTAASSPFKSYETAIGERSTIALTDGSTLILNTDTQVEVRYQVRERDIKLVKGQAIFEVAKDASRPFIVTAGDKRIIALGTAFDVRLDGVAGVEVVLIKGRVSVDEAPSLKANLRKQRAAPIELAAGERLIAHRGAPVTVQKTNTKEATSWREGRLTFRDVSLAEAVKEMNRYSPQKLVLSDDARVQRIKVSGIFKTGREATFIAALETIYPLQARRTGRDELTLFWNE